MKELYSLIRINSRKSVSHFAVFSKLLWLLSISQNRQTLLIYSQNVTNVKFINFSY